MKKSKAVILAYSFLKKAGHRMEMDLGAAEDNGTLSLGICLLPECNERFYLMGASYDTRFYVYVKHGSGSDPIVFFIDDSETDQHTVNFDSKYLCQRMKTMR